MSIRAIGLSIVTGVFAAAVLAPAGAVAARSPNTFDGTCRLTGRLVFDQPLGNEPRATTFTDTATGTCTGTLNGTPAEDIPVVNAVSGSGTLGCLAGETMTDDTLTFAHHLPLRIFTSATGGLTQFVAESKGAVSGQAVVEVNFLPYFDDATMAACQAGTLTSAQYDLVARTVTPLAG